MRFSPDDVVFRVQLNLQQVSCAAEALRSWLPLVSQIRPVAMEFEAAHPDGVRRGSSPISLSCPLSRAPRPSATEPRGTGCSPP